MDGLGRRDNAGKARFDLVPPEATEAVARVFQHGAEKYGDRNWQRGMPWSVAYASCMRHLNAWYRGEDLDVESNLSHLSHAATNLMMLLWYERNYLNGDDRPHRHLVRPRIGLDIDEVICDFVRGYTERYGVETPPKTWNFDPNIRERMDALKDDRAFWDGLRPKVDPKDIPFEPVCYITSRPIPTEWTAAWIARNGFPTVPVITVASGEEKVGEAKRHRVEVFVDDRFPTFAAMWKAGVCCLLFDAPHNRRYDVGLKRVRSLRDIPTL